MQTDATQDQAKARRDRNARIRRLVLMPVLVIGVALWIDHASSERARADALEAASAMRSVMVQYWGSRLSAPSALPTDGTGLQPIDPTMEAWLVERWDASEAGSGEVIVDSLPRCERATPRTSVTLQAQFPGTRPVELDIEIVDGVMRVIAVRDAPAATQDAASPQE